MARSKIYKTSVIRQARTTLDKIERAILIAEKLQHGPIRFKHIRRLLSRACSITLMIERIKSKNAMVSIKDLELIFFNPAIINKVLDTAQD